MVRNQDDIGAKKSCNIITGIVSGTNAYTHVKTLLTLVYLSFCSNVYSDIIVITHTFLKNLSFPAFCHGEAFSFVQRRNHFL